MKILDPNLLNNISTEFKNETLSLTKCILIGPINNINNNFFNVAYDNLNNLVSSGTPQNIYKKIEKFNKTFHRDSFDLSNINCKNDELLLLAFNITSLTNENIILNFGRTEDCKIWLNEKMIYNKSYSVINGFTESNGFSDSKYINTHLKSGNNLLIVELTNRNKLFSLKILPPFEILSFENNLFLKDYYTLTTKNNINIVQKNNIISFNKTYDFMVIPKDFWNINLNKEITIKVKSNNLEKSYKSTFYSTNSIKLNNFCDNNSFIINIDIYYELLTGEISKMNIKLLNSNYTRLLDDLEEKFENLIKASKTIKQTDVIINIEERIKKLKNLEESEVNPTLIEKELEVLSILFKVNSLNEFINCMSYKNTEFSIFFNSILDNKNQNYIIKLPLEYNKNINYPCIIHLIPNTTGNFIRFHNQLHYEKKFILIEISMRGVTQGSYIGEKAIKESIKEIQKNFNIDMDDISLIGYSSAAFAAWAMAQNYPDRFKNIATITGIPYYGTIKNLINTNILNISSDNDDVKQLSYDMPSKHLAKINNYYQGYLLKNADHLTLVNTLFSKEIINFFLRTTEIKEKNLFFRVERAIHNKTNWVEIFDFTNEFGTIEIEFSDENIYINTENLKSFKINLSKFIKSNSKIYINNQKLIIDINNISKDIYIIKKHTRFEVISQCQPKVKNRFKGTGILTLYMDNIKIILPKKEDSTLNKVANSLANTKTLGYESEVDICYEIEHWDTFDKSSHYSYNGNLILLDTEESILLKKIETLLPIRLNSDGFIYQDKFIEGDYCLIFILKNPYKINKNILIIYANKTTELLKNLFLRNFIISSYANGFNKWLNSECLISKDRNYFIIKSLTHLDNIEKL